MGDIGEAEAYRFLRRVEQTKGCWLWRGPFHRQGYGLFKLHGKTRLAHRISWLLYYGGPIDTVCVLHSCDNPRCVRPSHLFLGTQQDNIRDMLEKGRNRATWSFGEKNGRATLTRSEIYDIRKRHSLGDSSKELAGKFGVHQRTIYQIVMRRSWKHV